MDPMRAAAEATREIGLAVLATTLSLVVIFIPVSFMSSISGRFLYQFGITAAVAVMVSLLVSFTLTPMMSSRMLKQAKAGDGKGGHGHAHAKSRGGFYGLIDAAYTWMLRWSMRLRWGVAVGAIVVMWTAVPLYGLVKQEWVPSDVDEAEFQVNVTAPEGTSMTSMNQAMLQIEREIFELPGVDLVQNSSGAGWTSSTNQGRMHVRIASHEGRSLSFSRFMKALFKGKPSEAFEGNYSQRDVMTQVRRILSRYKDLRPGVRNYSAFSLGGAPVDIDFVIKGPDLEELNRYAETLREKIRDGEIEGIVDPDTTLKLDKPELRVEIDRARAADLRVDARQLGEALRIMVGGDDRVSRFHDYDANEDYDVELRLAPGERNERSDVERLYMVGRDEQNKPQLIALSNLTRLESTQTAGRIDRLDRERMVSLRAGVAPGWALGDRIDALRKAAAALNMPAGYTTTISGKGKELERTFTEFLWAFMLSIVFMYIILAMNYESLIHPFTILLSLPLTVPFALLAIYWSGGTLNLYTALGILVLFGVVKKNSILQIDHMNHLRAEGMPRALAIIEGNRDRLRPILMTTLALVAGMLPLAIGTGPGSEERRAVAIVVIGGQSLSLLLTLLVTPVAYSFFDDIGQLVRRVRGKGPDQDGDAAPPPPREDEELADEVQKPPRIREHKPALEPAGV
jgi:HAE1 family hydrophobic/amphiphilic exporter-1